MSTRHGRWPLSLAALLLLAACSGRSPRPSESPTSTADTPSTSSPARKSGVTQKRGGGYYKDDGPGDDIPDNLDDIPDAQPRLEPLHRFANKPYVVLGKSYVPDTSLKPFKQRGIASWYGKKFHGQKTSIGEPYDMFSMTAAHPTLAIPSYVRITHLGNGRSVVVRVTDRGPFHADRIIDLSYAAAYRLGYINNGSSLVEIETILPTDSTPLPYSLVKATPPTVPPAQPAQSAQPVFAGNERDEIEALASKLATRDAVPAAASARLEAPAATSGIYLQLGAFSSVDNAENLRAHLSRELDWLNEGIQINAGGGMHRVHLGPYANRGEAEKVAERIRSALGYKPTFISR